MDALKELAYLIARDQRRSIGHIDDPTLKGSKTREFYELLRANKLRDDKEAASHFYGPDSGKNSPAYQKLKTQLSDRLISSLFFTDFEKTSNSRTILLSDH